ncbi:hypothetical protein VZ94_20600 [Methylocucumis oryzae]|uniref:Uncharacterized protein n=1 Tax=Methylocucumis oryzae TaxID=1632867 RepID=A0A0F3II30_9GAMM|nr:hypothetical protein VZ94_20600 [Methylocucumis oryzae]
MVLRISVPLITFALNKNGKFFQWQQCGGILGNQKTYTERTTAANKAIGFDYQYYYFLYRILKLGMSIN